MADFDWQWDVAGTVLFIRSGGYGVVALQFPDAMLGSATSVAQRLQQLLGSTCKVYVLADTAYNPLAVDEVAALHIRANCVVHYGWASLTPVSQLPAFFVFPKSEVRDPAEAGRQLVAALASAAAVRERKVAVVIVDQAYQHVQQPLELAVHQALQDTAGAPQALAFSGPLPRVLQPAVIRPSRPAQTATSGRGGSCCRTAPGACSSAQEPACCSVPAAAQGCTLMGTGPAEAATSSTQMPGASKPEPPASAGPEPPAAAGLQSEAEACSQPAVATLTAAASSSTGSAVGSVAGLQWQLPAGVAEEDCAMVWFGSSSAPVLQLLQLAYNTHTWLCCEPESSSGGADTGQAGTSPAAERRPPAASQPQPLRLTEGLAPGTHALLRRRYYLVEKAKAASIVGILAGTLAAAGFRDAISLVRSAAQAAGKKAYTFVMGKPNPAKLANFPEVEVWVMVADPLGFLLDCKEYLAPIITPHEALLAFRDLSLVPGARYPLDFGEVLRAEQQPRHAAGEEGGAEGDQQGDSLALVHIGGLQLSDGSGRVGPNGRQLAARDAAEYLAVHRQYKGLETPLTGAAKLEPVKLLQGRVGRAAGYQDEPNTQTPLGSTAAQAP